MSYPLMKWRGFPPLRDLPTFQWVLVEIAVFALTEEILFYYSHRYLAKDEWVLVATLWTCGLLIGDVTGKLAQTVHRNPPCCLHTLQPFEKTRRLMVGKETVGSVKFLLLCIHVITRASQSQFCAHLCQNEWNIMGSEQKIILID